MRLKFWTYCRQCKCQLEPKAQFCQECGNKVPNYRQVLGIGTGLFIILLGAWYLLRPRENPTVLQRSVIPSGEVGKEIQSQSPSIQTIEKLLQDPTASDPQIKEAIVLLDQLLSTYPDFAYGLRLRASLFSLLRNYPQAVRTYQIYLEKFPNDHHARLALAKAYIQSDRVEDGLAECQNLYDQFPEFIGLLRTMHEIHERLGHQELALEFQAKYMAARKENRIDLQPPRIFHSKDPLKP